MKHREIFKDARWLSPRGSLDAALFRSEIEIKNPVQKAEITVCGLGWFILYINGRRVGADEFVPAYSDYHARPDMYLIYPLNDEQTHRIYVMKYDVSKYLHEGKNILGFEVGGGYYHQTARKGEGNMNYGNVKLCYRLDADGENSAPTERMLSAPRDILRVQIFSSAKRLILRALIAAGTLPRALLQARMSLLKSCRREVNFTFRTALPTE